VVRRDLYMIPFGALLPIEKITRRRPGAYCDTIYWRCVCTLCDSTVVFIRGRLQGGKAVTCGSRQCNDEFSRLYPWSTRKCLKCREIKPATEFTSFKRVCDSCRPRKKKKRRIFVNLVAERRGCSNPGCLWSGPLAYHQIDFHHKDPSTKRFVIATAKARKLSLLIEELEKCISLCACCHRAVHGGLVDVSKLHTIKIDDTDLGNTDLRSDDIAYLKHGCCKG
jgi:hypothetical protein